MPRALAGVWDCFLVNDELDLLEFRLRYLSSVVDHFVIVEAPLTFSGRPKPLSFTAALTRFAPWQDKITHRVVDLAALGEVHPREREAAQRATIREVLGGAADDDLVLVGDLDEIPFREVVRDLRDNLGRPTRLIMRWAMYRANFEAPREWVDGTKACRARDRGDQREMGLILGDMEAPHMAGRDGDVRQEAGWHLSYVGPVAFVQNKVGALCERSLDRADLTTDAHVERCLELAVFLDGRFALRRVPPEMFDDLVRELVAYRADTVDLRHAPARWRITSYLAYSRFLYWGRIPGRVARLVDRRPWRTLAMLGIPIVAADQAIRFAVRHRLRAAALRLVRRREIFPR